MGVVDRAIVHWDAADYTDITGVASWPDKVNSLSWLNTYIKGKIANAQAYNPSVGAIPVVNGAADAFRMADPEPTHYDVRVKIDFARLNISAVSFILSQAPCFQLALNNAGGAYFYYWTSSTNRTSRSIPGAAWPTSGVRWVRVVFLASGSELFISTDETQDVWTSLGTAAGGTSWAGNSQTMQFVVDNVGTAAEINTISAFQVLDPDNSNAVVAAWDIEDYTESDPYNNNAAVGGAYTFVTNPSIGTRIVATEPCVWGTSAYNWRSIAPYKTVKDATVVLFSIPQKSSTDSTSRLLFALDTGVNDITVETTHSTGIITGKFGSSFGTIPVEYGRNMLALRYTDAGSGLTELIQNHGTPITRVGQTTAIPDKIYYSGYTDWGILHLMVFDEALSDADLLTLEGELYGSGPGPSPSTPVHALTSGQLQHGAMGFAPRVWR